MQIFFEEAQTPDSIKLVNPLVYKFNLGNPGVVKQSPREDCLANECHKNVLDYISRYGGERIIGYYFLQEVGTSNVIGVYHSLWQKPGGNIVDITPNNLNKIIFSPSMDYMDYPSISFYNNEYYWMDENNNWIEA